MMSLIDSPDNGATEIPGTSNDSLMVFLAGPIRHWWTPGVENSRLHRLYCKTRDYVHLELSADFLVYSPHRAWRGPWDKRAQFINDAAVRTADVFVWLRVDGVLAHGTDEELWLAHENFKSCFMLQVGDKYDTAAELKLIKQSLFVLEVERKADHGNY